MSAITAGAVIWTALLVALVAGVTLLLLIPNPALAVAIAVVVCGGGVWLAWRSCQPDPGPQP